MPLDGSLFALIFGILLWFSEIVSNFTGLILIWSRNKVEDIPFPELEDADYPHIDVLIATHNEEPDLLKKTVNACCHLDYPEKSHVHIFISDDANRPEIKALADSFDVGYIGLENNKHAKSGNLNNALDQTNSPLIATFDADMIPYSDFLMQTVPYFINNMNERKEDDSIKPIGLIQTPQSFYNADTFQYNLFSEKSIPNEQDFFSREINLLNNAHGAAIYTGSNTVISRKAIESVGGFPTDTITEDFELGALINTKGYKNVSTKEPMASGLTPTDIPSVLNQRIRWGRGVVQSVHNLNLLFNRQLTLAQKLVYLNGYLYWWSFSRRILYIMAPILFAVFNIQVVDTNFLLLLIFWLPSYFFLHLSMQDISSMIRTQRWGEVQETIFAPYLVIPVFLQAIGFKETKFKVTNKGNTQSKKDLLFILPHLILWILALYGLISFNWGKYGSEIIYGSIISFWLFTHLFNLTFSILFYLGRPIHRKSERFLRRVPVTVQSEGESLQFMTRDLSEKGLSFKSDYPYYFDSDKTLDMSIERDPYSAQLKAKLVRVYKEEKCWVYSFELQPLNQNNERQFFQIIYDGFNKYLPQFNDEWVTHIDRLVENIVKRTQKSKTASKSPKKTPLIYTNKTLDYNGKTVQLRSFDFETLRFDQPLTESASEILSINLAGSQLRLRQDEREPEVYNLINREALKKSGEVIGLYNYFAERRESLVDNHS
ncbi:MAG: glycosyltransferase [Alkalibacterium sp.]|nr:glycosyltransferase [Alkalibacterium sp.]